VPGGDVRRIGGGRLVAEEVHVVGAVGQRFDGAQFAFQCLGIEHARRNRTQPAGTADGSG